MSSKNKNMRNGKSGGNRQNKPNRRMAIPHPMTISGLEIRHAPTLRWRAIAAFSPLVVTFQNLLDAMLVATTAVAGTDLFQAVRIRAVRIWGMPAIGGASSVSVEFAGTTTGLVGDQSIHTDTSMGVEPAYVSASPNSRSLASDYQLSTANTAFNISGPAGSVVDVDLSFRGPTFGAASTAVQNALVGATAGSQYLRGFDGLAVATSNFVPEFDIGRI